ncbi:hypothetical protein FRC02_009461 [Tulasnella sp. 418]|nr:hypothetical protein FRC02_009461 [Tulasnella sp. 418]
MLSTVASTSLTLSMRRMASTAAALKPIESSYSVPETAEEQPASTSFSTIQGLINPSLYKAITVKPFQHTDMTSVQAAVLELLPDLAVPPTSNSSTPRDLLVKAKTGTGKTLAFLVPAIEARLNAIEEAGKRALAESGLGDSSSAARKILSDAKRNFQRKHAGVVVISPTRELAIQIAAEASKLTEHLGLGVHLFVGGENKGFQLRDYARYSKDIVVVTPGRFTDILENSDEVKPTMQKINTVVLDEADTLLDMGFRADIERILLHLPPKNERQTLLFSATVSKAVRQIASEAMTRNHLFINCVNEDDSPVHAHIPQHYTALSSPKDQMYHIMSLLAHDQLKHPGTSKTIVFCPTTKMTQLMGDLIRRLTSTLPAEDRTKVYEIHSKKDQNQRNRTSNRFREDKQVSILVTSDVSARGVDYPGVTRVIQIGAPSTPDQYVHRVGRTGRGKAVEGRGDLILQPFEASYPEISLNQVPFTPITVDGISHEVQELATKFDENPRSFFGKSQPEKPAEASNRFRDQRERFSRPLTYRPGVSDRVLEMQGEVDAAVADISEEKVEEVFTASLGFYGSLNEDIGISRSEILDGCKEWIKEGFGKPVPHVSTAFLAKLGYGPGSSPVSRDRRNSRSFSKPRRQNEWLDRGNPRRTFDRRDKQGGRDNFRSSSRGRFEEGDRSGFRRSRDREDRDERPSRRW